MSTFDLSTIVQLPMGVAQKHPVIASIVMIVGAVSVVKAVMNVVSRGSA